MKIGVYGGTFDPIHYGHIDLALYAAKMFALEKVIFVPSGNSYMKDHVTPAVNRYAMTELALRPHPNLVPSNMEILRDGPSYSYETILLIKNMYPDAIIHFLIGEDTLYHLYLWKKVNILLENAVILIAGRGSLENNNNVPDSDALKGKTLEEVIAYYKKEYGADMKFFQYDNPISSSFLRKHFYDGTDLSEYLPSNIINYIQENHLYAAKEKTE